jgi:hypothetical protein
MIRSTLNYIMRWNYFLVFFLLSTPLFAQFRLRVRNPEELHAEQRRVVGTWCRQDFEGLRVANGGWDKFKSLTNLKTNPDSSTIVIISRYQIEQHDPQAVSWNLDVSYTVIGRFDPSSGYVPDTGSDTVTFQTKDIDGNILITNMEPVSPHLAKKAALEWMKHELETTTSEVEKFYLASAIKALEPAPATASAQDGK